MMVLLQLLGGSTVGYLIASLIESVLHEKISDAPMSAVRKWRRYPRLFRFLIRTHFSHHAIHHIKTFRPDHVTQFSSEEERQALDKILDRYGAHGVIIKDSDYSVKLHGSGAFVFTFPLLVAGVVAYAVAGPWFALGALPALALPPVLSNWVHPWLHRPQAEAVRRAPLPISLLLRSAYGRAMYRNHFIHHRYSDSNYNLLLGADILRGSVRRPTSDDRAEMQRIGIPAGRHATAGER